MSHPHRGCRPLPGIFVVVGPKTVRNWGALCGEPGARLFPWHHTTSCDFALNLSSEIVQLEYNGYDC